VLHSRGVDLLSLEGGWGMILVHFKRTIDNELIVAKFPVKDRSEASAIAMILWGFEGMEWVKVSIDDDIVLTLPMEFAQ
jgi:hypothetical protein